jgi:hypothetical protein
MSASLDSDGATALEEVAPAVGASLRILLVLHHHSHWLALSSSSFGRGSAHVETAPTRNVLHVPFGPDAGAAEVQNEAPSRQQCD